MFLSLSTEPKHFATALKYWATKSILRLVWWRNSSNILLYLKYSTFSWLADRATTWHFELRVYALNQLRYEMRHSKCTRISMAGENRFSRKFSFLPKELTNKMSTVITAWVSNVNRKVYPYCANYKTVRAYYILFILRWIRWTKWNYCHTF